MSSDEFEHHRPFLMGVAYRMLSSATEAEDAVQDAWLRWRSTDPASISNVRAWLCTTVMRIAMDRLTSARARRETYPGTWLPEPVLTSSPFDLESIEFGVLLLLERLEPKERAVFVLHRGFDFSHSEIAEALEITEDHSRQLLHRAKTHVTGHRPPLNVTREAQQRLLAAFVKAVAQGDVDAITRVVAEDVVLIGDHAEGKRGAILRPILGRINVARFFAAQGGRTASEQGLEVEIVDTNGWPALVGRREGVVAFVMHVETDGANIVAINSVLNPQKLLLRTVN
jgi:RNA polymerase sigma-70 factor (ECF subfamily)